ncbi:CBM1 domain-containing protein [Favolaschia claudopus]|uniref:CBM1 domain-containing protein n=1 Tax=Favolaschia claudopus TaxID=2862362 RepID=A0AAW0DBY5_9AGAR
MGDIQTRPFSKNYSGLINQSVITLVITVVCVTGQELMKRARRGTKYNPETQALGSRESWEFGYLYQGRSWAKYPSPPTPRGWPLSWVPQVVWYPPDKMNELRGVDATLYIRWLRGCFFFVLLHTFTTFPILFPIHVEFSSDSISKKSMTRASITSLVASPKGLSLLWIHIVLLFWITLSWMGTLLWICHGAFQLRADKIAIAVRRMAAQDPADTTCYPHPHPQYAFTDVPSQDRHHPNTGLRLRTVMVSNVPPALRDEKTLKEYFEYYLSREIEKPSLGLTSSTQPGFINKSVAFLFNRAKRLPIAPIPLSSAARDQASTDKKNEASTSEPTNSAPVIEKVVVARKMTELASLLERREEILRSLETAHIKLAKKTVLAVQHAMARQDAHKPAVSTHHKPKRRVGDAERDNGDEGTLSEEDRMKQLIEVIGPFVEEFGLRSNAPRTKKALFSKHEFRKVRQEGSQDSDSDAGEGQVYPPTSPVKTVHGRTIYDALLSLPRSSLDAYQPLINLSHLFRGKIVPSIDYYTAKFNLLTSFITENRAKAVADFDPVSTAFVTFADPADARRACNYLAVHPNNPLQCLITMAPAYQDLDWIRVMKSSYNGEFVKDWVVNIGVWGFTVFWLFPVSLLVGLVSIQNISAFLPALKAYLDRHQWEEDLIQSFLPTLLVSLLALSIPPILLLIAKKAHTITTLSALHDLILTRYYKFLIVNVLVFFCVGTAALQSVLNSFKAVQTSNVNILQIVADSFPTAGPFYVGWLIFNVGMHGGFEIALLGLPLILYPKTRGQVTPRKRAVGIRPRTFNFYYWLPTHLLVIHVLMLFMILNPFVIPFGAIYFFIEAGVVKNQVSCRYEYFFMFLRSMIQLIHVYAKNYELNGQVIMVRIARYSLDGLILSQAVFMAYMIVLKKTANVALAAILVVFTATVKLLITRMIRTQFEHDDIVEAQLIVSRAHDAENGHEHPNHDRDSNEHDSAEERSPPPPADTLFSFRLPAWVNLSYATVRPHRPVKYRPNPFGPRDQSFSRLGSMNFESPNKRSSEAQRLINGHGQSRLPGGSKEQPHITHDMSGPVVPHPPLPVWDDDDTADLPYDNPFYTRTISNALWLPRDPFGKLDLDDTLDLNIALTVDSAGGRLGMWTELPESASPQPMSEISSVTTPPEERTVSELTSQEYDGSEEIELPLIIAKRAQAKDDVEQTMRPRRNSTFRRKPSGTSTIGSKARRPSLAPRISSRSVSDTGRGRSASIMSTLRPPTIGRVRSTDWELGVRPDVHAQAEFVVAHSASSLSVEPPPMNQQRSNISTQAAIAHEVLAEEQVALADRLEEEEREAEKASKPRSWFTAWMFKSDPPAQPPAANR